jgi:hypothetical protein
MLDDLVIDSVKMVKPAQWAHLDKNWSEEISDEHSSIDAAVLIGADQPRLLPVHKLDAGGNPIETSTAVLMKSRLT